MNPRTTERSRTRGVSFLQTVGLSHIYLDAHPAETEREIRFPSVGMGVGRHLRILMNCLATIFGDLTE